MGPMACDCGSMGNACSCDQKRFAHIAALSIRAAAQIQVDAVSQVCLAGSECSRTQARWAMCRHPRPSITAASRPATARVPSSSSAPLSRAALRHSADRAPQAAPALGRARMLRAWLLSSSHCSPEMTHLQLQSAPMLVSGRARMRRAWLLSSTYPSPEMTHLQRRSAPLAAAHCMGPTNASQALRGPFLQVMQALRRCCREQQVAHVMGPIMAGHRVSSLHTHRVRHRHQGQRQQLAHLP